MTEHMTAFPVSGVNDVSISVISENDFFNGGAEHKKFVKGVIGTEAKSREVNLVERGITFPPQEYLSKWKLLKDAGLPVVPTVRISSRGTLLVTDLTCDGSEIYGKGKWGEIKVGNYPYDIHREVDERFLEITDLRNISQLEDEIERNIQLANKAEICLPFDDPFELVVKPSGAWKLYILDVMEADVWDVDGGERFVRRGNAEYAKTFLDQIRDIRLVLEAVRNDDKYDTYTLEDVLSNMRWKFVEASMGY